MKSIFFVAVAVVLTAVIQTAGAQVNYRTNQAKVTDIKDVIDTNKTGPTRIVGTTIGFYVEGKNGYTKSQAVFCESYIPTQIESIYNSIRTGFETKRPVYLELQSHGTTYCIFDAAVSLD